MKNKKNYDVIIIGRGHGGVSSAIAAKKGLLTLLVERYGLLGGMATAGLVNPFMVYTLKNQNLTTSVFNELIKCLEEEGALSPDKHIFDDEIMKTVLDKMMSKYGVDVLNARNFADGISRSKYPIDIYNLASSGTVIKRIKNDDYYEIPYRCLVPKNK